MNAVSYFAFKLIKGFYHPEIAGQAVPESCTGVTKASIVSKSFSLYTIALTREDKLWEDTRDCQGKRRIKCRI